jgi:glycosyltransferase involved in cell wall biosynthesis
MNKSAVIYEFPQMKYPEQKGLISIIVPIYNNEIYLRECLDSILAQTFSNWEAILVDDGSTDNTGKIIDEYAKKDLRFIAIHKQNQGTLLARKTGLENSKGEFIANIDHDDRYYPQFLEKMYAKIIETDSDFVWCKVQVACEDKKNEQHVLLSSLSDCEWPASAAENVAIMLNSNRRINWETWNKLIKREIYAKVCFPQIRLILGEDPVQMLQVAYHSKQVAFVSKTLYFFRTTGVSSKPLPGLPSIIYEFWIRKMLELLFNRIIPNNIIKTFNALGLGIAHNYFSLEKKARVQFKEEIEPILPELIKMERKLNFKICLFLASKGIEFPFKLRESIRKMVKRI